MGDHPSKDMVNIASLNNQPFTPLHSAPLSFQSNRRVVCDSLEFLQDQGLVDQSHTRIW